MGASREKISTVLGRQRVQKPRRGFDDSTSWRLTLHTRLQSRDVVEEDQEHRRRVQAPEAGSYPSPIMMSQNTFLPRVTADQPEALGYFSDDAMLNRRSRDRGGDFGANLAIIAVGASHGVALRGLPPASSAIGS